MNARRLVFPESGRVEVEEFVVDDTPAAGEVLVENAYGLVSPGTELALFNGTHVGLKNPANRYAKYPFRPGYAAVGRVLRAGAGIVGVTEGDWVVTRSHHASHAKLPAFRLPLGLTDERLAPFAFLAEIALGGVFWSDVKLGMTACVVGQGIVGNLAAQLLRAAGASQVFVMDPVAQRLDRSRRCGLQDTLGVPLAEARAIIAERTGGRMCHVAVEATGVPELIADVLPLAGPTGKVVLLGSPRGHATVDAYTHVHAPCVSVVGAHINYLPDRLYARAPDPVDLGLSLIAQGRLVVEPLITGVAPAADAAAAYADLRDRPQDHLATLLDLRQWGTGFPAGI